MKKILLASTALVAFGAFAAQAAEPISLKIGGILKEQVAFFKQDAMNAATANDTAGNDTYQRFFQQSFAQINLTGATKLDNGITVAVETQFMATQYNDSRGAAGALGATNANDNVRRTFMTISGIFGSVIAGEREDVTYITAVSAPDVGWGLQDGDFGDLWSNPAGHAGFFQTNNSRYSARTTKLTYMTPAFYGLTAGVTYAPSISQASANPLSPLSNDDSSVNANLTAGANSSINRSSFSGDAYYEALAYNNKFGGVSVKANFGAGQYNYNSMATYMAGMQVGYAGFTLGGSYMLRSVDNKGNTQWYGQTTSANVAAVSTLAGPGAKGGLSWAGQSYDAALAYQTGPYGVSFGYFHDRSASTAHAADSTSLYQLSGAYQMGPGISWRTSLLYITTDTGASAEIKNTNANNGYGALTGILVSF